MDISNSIHIDGLNYGEALARFGSEAAFIDIVKSFIKTVPDLLEKTKRVSRENLDEYAVVVHGIKGVSRTIGAAAIGMKAEELEHAAKRRLLEFCITENVVFQQMTAKLISGLTAFVESRSVNIRKEMKAAPDENLLAQLKTACNRYDMTEIDKIMEELDSFSYRENNDIIEKIRDCLRSSDFPSIVALL
ncbi:MAG: Hpt domain-containing protein [Spirochaetaceae bacterium]|jgi:HPt (histidine-containing phosphotransfer) domain-containing protein|nr:Hpt domain-containing protein [Spirochaetaceae bacterium]